MTLEGKGRLKVKEVAWRVQPGWMKTAVRTASQGRVVIPAMPLSYGPQPQPIPHICRGVDHGITA